MKIRRGARPFFVSIVMILYFQNERGENSNLLLIRSFLETLLARVVADRKE
jgi:hypothetical protein